MSSNDKEVTPVKQGRPRKNFDDVKFDSWDMLDAVISFTDMLGCCELLDVSESTLERRIREEFDVTFEVYREKKLARMKYNIYRKQYEVAVKNGDSKMLIWLGKQLLGQKDNHGVEIKAVELPSKYEIVTYGKDAIETTAKEVDNEPRVQEQNDSQS